MESDRSSKRRKLDTPETKTTSKKITPITHSRYQKKETHTAALVTGELSENSGPLSSQEPSKAHDDWKIAKARAAAVLKSKKETDIYDDIEGAHAPPRRQMASVPRRKVPPHPMRNQRQEAQSSPVKNAGATTLGFFKQFQKKTFEDEIKELERKAREQAENGDSGSGESETPKLKESRRRSERHEREEEIEDSEPERDGVRPKRNGILSTPTTAKARPQHASRSSAKPATSGPGPAREASVSTHVKNKPRKATTTRPTGITIPVKQLQKIQRLVLEQLTGKRPVPLTNLADEYAKASQLIVQTITAGESNSMLLIGSRGSGKSALINQILREQHLEHANDFHVVRLNGFIHTDDKIALREIWRQLGREMDTNEDGGTTSKNHADTMAQLLALLSHPTEVGLEQDGQLTKSVIIILDEFELFASHPRQTLLYNLFDIAQSRKAPIAVLGCTTRVDVAESLEKRVKSRFSHRYVHLSLAKSYHGFVEVCKASLMLEVDDEMKMDVKMIDAVASWSHTVEETIATPEFQRCLRRMYHTTKAVPDFMASVLLPIVSIPMDAIHDTSGLADHLATSLQSSTLRPPDSKLDLLPSLSHLQLALLICAARLQAIYNSDLISFNLAYEEYKVLASKARLQASSSGGVGARVSGKEVARDAWESLLGTGLVIADGRGGGGGSGRADVGLEEIGMCEGSVELGGWGRWCKEI